MAAEVDPSKEEPKKKKFKSEKSRMYSFVRFFNRTARFVDVVWLNYEGIGVKYVTLKPKQFVDINTFVGHPWIFRDSQTGEKMVVQLKEVYEPEKSQGGPANSPPQRKLVSITIPVYSLKDRCLQEVRKLVHRSDIRNLEIPTTLIKKLLAMEHQCPSLSHSQHQQSSNGHSSSDNSNNGDPNDP